MPGTAKTSETRVLIAEARRFSAKRLSHFGLVSNSKVPGEILRKELQLPRAHVRDLERLLDKGGISMRGFDRCLRLSWSISDLEGRESPSKADVELALAMRGTDSLEELA
jgi:magnesium chelatase family protein